MYQNPMLEIRVTNWSLYYEYVRIIPAALGGDGNDKTLSLMLDVDLIRV